MAESSRPDSSGLGVTKEFYERLASGWGADGIYGSPTDPALVYADGSGTRRAWIRPGRAGVLRGFDWDSGAPGDAAIPVDLPANTSGLPRVDWIVLRLTRSTTWPVRAGFVQGQPGSTTMPALNQGIGSAGVFEMPIAAATVANGATTLSGGAIARREWYLGDDGGLLCTAATMPPYVMPGTVVNQTDTGSVYVGVIGPPNNTRSWKLIGDDAIATFTNAATWTCTGGLYRRNGLVAATLSVRRNANLAGGATATVGTIPAGFRPPVDWQAVALIPNSTAEKVAFANFLANGAVTLTTPNAGGFGANASVAIAASSWPAS